MSNKNEQKALKNNLLVQVVPQKENENLPEIINKIGTYLGVKNDSKYTAFRLGKDNTKHNVIKVIFEDETTKTNFLKSKKKFEMKSTDVGYTKENKIFLNHELTKTLIYSWQQKNLKKNITTNFSGWETEISS